MVGSVGKKKQGSSGDDITEFILRGDEEPVAGSQSTRRSDEASNDRGAKGCRKVDANGTNKRRNTSDSGSGEKRA
jgi:hypothetical protein